MKKQLILTILIFALLLHSCSLKVDFEDTQGYISVKVKGNNRNGSVSINGYLDLDIIGEDDDGISFISIEIPALNIDLLIDNNSNNNRWEISQTFNTNDAISEGVHSIYVVLKDKKRNEYSKTATFKIE